MEILLCHKVEKQIPKRGNRTQYNVITHSKPVFYKCRFATVTVLSSVRLFACGMQIISGYQVTDFITAF